MRRSSTSGRRSSRRAAAVLSAVAVGGLLLGGCASTTGPTGNATAAPSKFTPAKQDASAPITVWVDATRLPIVKAYQKANPDVKMKIVTYSGDDDGSLDLQTKIELYNRAGSGWPDVVFSQVPDDTTWGVKAGVDWIAPLDTLVPKATLDGFAENSLAVCTFGGSAYCLRNDLGQNVLWYNQKLMKQFGYTVPTTWEEYEALGKKVSAEHPGYVIGSVGDGWAPEVYFSASQCPMNKVTGNALTIDPTSPNCTRMASLLDTSIADKSIATAGTFDNSFVKDTSKKVLMMAGPSWYGQALFNDAYKIPAGQMAAAPPLKWAADTTTYTGDVGGGIWMVSKHSANLKASAALIVAMTTADAYQLQAPTYPAFKTAATSWLAGQKTEGYFADDVAPAFTQAASQLWPGWSSVSYSAEQVWSSAVVPGLTAGKSMTSLMTPWAAAVKNQAKSVGYTVG
ncbi:ABC transporter substrate-binding protein [Streptacidiphilus sp. PAMC 29251]